MWPEKRGTCDEVLESLEKIYNECVRSEEYCTKPAPGSPPVLAGRKHLELRPRRFRDEFTSYTDIPKSDGSYNETSIGTANERGADISPGKHAKSRGPGGTSTEGHGQQQAISLVSSQHGRRASKGFRRILSAFGCFQ